MRIAAVFVTYGDRRELLLSALNSALACESVKQVVIVDNNSEKSLINDIGPNFTKRTGKVVRYQRNAENTGSAGGYAQAIALARSLPDIDAILLLDDDLCISQASIEAASEQMLSQPNVVFQIPRSDRAEQFAYLNGTKSPTISTNSFHDFSLVSLPARVRRARPQRVSLVSVEFATFAGLVIPINVALDVALPDARLFLYCDDYDYVRRIINDGFLVNLIDVAPLTSIDASWNQDHHISPAFFDPYASPTRCYYSVRNRVIYERKYHVNSNLLYAANMVSLLSVGLLISLFEFRSPRATFKRLSLILSAIIAGIKNDLQHRRP